MERCRRAGKAVVAKQHGAEHVEKVIAKPLFLHGVNLADESLNKIVKRGLSNRAIKKYSEKSNQKYYNTKTPRKKLRSKTLKDFPNYRFYATKLLRHVARLDEVDLRHKSHKKFIRP